MLSMNEEDRTALRLQFQDATLDIPIFLAYHRRCVPGSCEALCCYTGAVLSDQEETTITEIIANHADSLKEWLPHLPDTPCEKVRLYGTNTISLMTKVHPHNYRQELPEHFNHTRCVFADEGGQCGLQRLAIRQEKHMWWYKPLECWLHPIKLITDPKPMITIPTEANDPYYTGGYPGFTAFTSCGKVTADGEPGYKIFFQELEALGTLLERDLIGEIKAHITKKL